MLPDRPLSRSAKLEQRGSARARILALVATAAMTAAIVAAPALVSAAETCGGGRPFELLGGEDDESGIGGTGVVERPRDSDASRPQAGDESSGIGGTGHRPAPPTDSGSGIGGTGLLGRITRVDGLCVNGFEIEIPAEVSVEAATGGGVAGATASSLEVGQVVWVRVVQQDGQWVARRVVLLPAAGPARDAQAERLIRNGRGLRYLSLEGVVGGSRESPRIGHLRLDLGEERPRAVREGLEPGMRIRVGGRVSPEGVFRVAPQRRLDRPAPDMRPEIRPAPRGDRSRRGRPHPQRPERPDPEVRPRPDFERPRPAVRPRALDRP